MVECDLAKVEVAGSTPVSRSIILPAVAPRSGEGLCSQTTAVGILFRARYPSGKGEVCKTFMRRFDSDPRLQTFNPLLIIPSLLPSAALKTLIPFNPLLDLHPPVLTEHLCSPLLPKQTMPRRLTASKRNPPGRLPSPRFRAQIHPLIHGIRWVCLPDGVTIWRR